jgi:hypothetical protein
VGSRGSSQHRPAATNRAYTAAAALVVLAYAALLLISPALGPTDDYAFLSTLESGKPLPFYGRNFPFYDDARLGRFDPLVAQEYNLVAPISAAPAAFYVFNALQLLVFALLLFRILREATDDERVVAGAAMLVFLSPGLTNAWFRLQLGERGAAFFLAVFLVSHLWLGRTGSPLAAGGALASANMALYYKEPVFLALGVYAAAHLVLAGARAAKIVRIVDGLVVASALAFIITYYLRVYPDRGTWLYSSSLYPWLVVAVKNLLNYTLFSDPVAMLLAFPLAGFRVYTILAGRRTPHPLFDPMLLAGCAYASVFFVMNIYGPYYFLPVYVFVLPALVYFLVTRRYLAQPAWKVLVACAAVALVLDTIPSSLHYLAYNKYLPVNFNQSIDFLASDIRARGRDEHRRIFLDGVVRARDTTVFLIFGEFLQHRGLTLRDFDVESDLAPTRPVAPPILRAQYLREYGPYRGGPVPAPVRGDYRVVSPAGERDVTERYLASLRADYRLVFATHSPFALPAYDAKTLVKEVLASRLTADQRTRRGLIVSENALERPDFYVFVHK